MAQIDTSIYRNFIPTDFMGSYQQGVSLRDMLDERRKKKAVQDVFKKNVIQGEGGQVTFNQERVLSDLAKIDPESYVRFKKANDEQVQTRENELMTRAKFGLRPVMDEKGNIVKFERDPNFEDPYANINAALKLGQIQDLQGKGYLREDIQKLRLAREQAEIERIKARSNNNKKNYNANQFKSGGFAKRAIQAENILGQLVDSGFDPTSMSGNLQEEYLPSFLEGFKSQDLKSYTQTKNNFISAVLRKESGAAISDEEYSRENKKYFPQAGDGRATLAAKRAARLQAIENLRAEAGGAFNEIKTIEAPSISGKKNNKKVIKKSNEIDW